MRISITTLLVGLAFWGFGAVMFISIGNSQSVLEANLRMIETGEARKVELTVDKKWSQRGTDKSNTYWASFTPFNESRWFTYNEWIGLSVGQSFDAHLVGNELVIAELDVLQPDSKWTMLWLCGGLGTLILVVPFLLSFLPAGTLQRDLFNWSAAKPAKADHRTTQIIKKQIAAREKNLRPLQSKHRVVVNETPERNAHQTLLHLPASTSQQEDSVKARYYPPAA